MRVSGDVSTMNHNIFNKIIERVTSEVWTIRTEEGYYSKSFVLFCSNKDALKVQGIKMIHEQIEKYGLHIPLISGLRCRLGEDSFIKNYLDKGSRRDILFFRSLEEKEKEEMYQILKDKFIEFVDRYDGTVDNYNIFRILGNNTGFVPYIFHVSKETLHHV